MLSADGIRRVGRFTRSGFVDSLDAELILIAFDEVIHGAFQHISLDLSALLPVAEAFLHPTTHASNIGHKKNWNRENENIHRLHILNHKKIENDQELMNVHSPSE